MFLPRDLGEMNDVYKIFYNNTPTKDYFETTDYQELIKRPSMWIRYTDQGKLSLAPPLSAASDMDNGDCEIVTWCRI